MSGAEVDAFTLAVLAMCICVALALVLLGFVAWLARGGRR